MHEQDLANVIAETLYERLDDSSPDARTFAQAGLMTSASGTVFSYVDEDGVTHEYQIAVVKSR